ncbi:hypothetical protein ACIRFH_28635 [Streptomyces sp. NPDC093586]|uniref:hypothetical protein n=1 Tax=Streptomyces sp. NPDC093586 TaxID=3366042 RepID=UPI00380BF721
MVTAPATVPGTLLLGRYDDKGALRYTGRTTSLARATEAALAGLLTPAGGDHPWTGRTFTAGWGSRAALDATLVRPELVVEVAVDVARDRAGRWRHPVRLRAHLALEVADEGERVVRHDGDAGSMSGSRALDTAYWRRCAYGLVTPLSRVGR